MKRLYIFSSNIYRILDIEEKPITRRELSSQLCTILEIVDVATNEFPYSRRIIINNEDVAFLLNRNIGDHIDFYWYWITRKGAWKTMVDSIIKNHGQSIH